MTYTHRHKRTGKRCRIIHESNHDGWTVYHVEVEGESPGRYLWPRQAFRRHHREILAAQPVAPTLALLLALWLLLLPWVGGRPVLTSSTGCGHDGWPRCTEVRR